MQKLELGQYSGHAAAMPQARPDAPRRQSGMKSDPEVAAFLDAVSQPLENDPPARDWVAANLTARLAALPPPPTGALADLTQRLLAHWERRRFGWIGVAVAISAVAITGGHLLVTTTAKTSAANPTWVLASLSGTQRLAAAVLLDGEHAETRAKAYVKAAPKDLAARELWLMEAPDGNEEMRKFVAECERLDPGNGVYQLRYCLWRYQHNPGSQQSRFSPSPEAAQEALAAFRQGLQAERVQSHLGGLMREVATAVAGPHDYDRARKIAALASTERPNPPVRPNVPAQPGYADTYSLYAGLTMLPYSPLAPVYRSDTVGLTEAVQLNLRFYEKTAPFLADGALVQAPFSGGWCMLDWWGEMTHDTNAARPPALSQAECRRLMDSYPPSFPFDVSTSNKPLAGLGNDPRQLADLRELGLTERLFEPLIQMQWAVSDRTYAWYAAGGLLVGAFGLRRLSLVHFRPPGRVADGLQWLVPAGDAWLGGAMAVGLTVGSLAALMATFPAARQFPLRIEPDMYFYAPTAALLLCAVFACAAGAVRLRGRALGWKGPHLVLVWLPVAIAIASVAVQFYFKTTDPQYSTWRFDCWMIGPLGLQAAINLATAALGGLWLGVGLLTWWFGARRRFLERAVLLRTAARFMLVASILMCGVAGWCRVRELAWGKRDAMFNTGPGQLEILRLRDDLKAHWHAADTAIFRKPIAEFEKHPPPRQ